MSRFFRCLCVFAVNKTCVQYVCLLLLLHVLRSLVSRKIKFHFLGIRMRRRCRGAAPWTWAIGLDDACVGRCRFVPAIVAALAGDAGVLCGDECVDINSADFLESALRFVRTWPLLSLTRLWSSRMAIEAPPGMRRDMLITRRVNAFLSADSPSATKLSIIDATRATISLSVDSSRCGAGLGASGPGVAMKPIRWMPHTMQRLASLSFSAWHPLHFHVCMLRKIQRRHWTAD